MPRRVIALDEIVGAALALLDDVGPAGFTMRALADRLGTYPASVYWHVGNRDQVLALAVERALAELTVPDSARTSWRDWLAELATDYRRVLHAHPNVAQLVSSQLLVSPPALRLVEAILGVLDSAGFRGPALPLAYNAYVGSVTGWVSVELSADPVDADSGWREEFALSVRALDPAAFPTIRANFDHVADSVIALRWHGGRQRPMDEAFGTALAVWLDGLEAQLGR